MNYRCARVFLLIAALILLPGAVKVLGHESCSVHTPPVFVSPIAKPAVPSVPATPAEPGFPGKVSTAPTLPSVLAATTAGTTNGVPMPPVRPILLRVRDNSSPIEERRLLIKPLAEHRDAAALMALGNENLYLRGEAIKALGQVSTPEVGKYLQGKLNDPTPRVAAAAVRSLAQVKGAAAVPAITAALEANRDRPDGYEDVVRGSAVQVLAMTCSVAH